MFLFKATHMRPKGSLHRMLGVPSSHNLPKTFLDVIDITPINNIAYNPTKIGKPHVRVTHLMKKEAVLYRTAIRLAENARKNKKKSCGCA